MDNFFEKFSIFDFFNLIGTGAIFLIGLQVTGIDIIGLLSVLIGIKIYQENSAMCIIIFAATILCTCYIIGSCIQELGSLWNKKIEKKAISNIFSNLNVFGKEKVITNEIKRKIYEKELKTLLNAKCSEEKTPDVTRDQCEYFFAYCVYYIEVRNHNKKTEKMRALYGISSMLSVCFFILFIISICNLLYRSINIRISYLDIVFISIFFILSIVFRFRMIKNLLYRIRMVLAVYEASIDQEQSAKMPQHDFYNFLNY